MLPYGGTIDGADVESVQRGGRDVRIERIFGIPQTQRLKDVFVQQLVNGLATDFFQHLLEKHEVRVRIVEVLTRRISGRLRSGYPNRDQLIVRPFPERVFQENVLELREIDVR